MKPVFAIVTALAALAFAAPSPEADGIESPVEKRQTSGCGPCKNGTRRCWSCQPPGACISYNQDC